MYAAIAIDNARLYAEAGRGSRGEIIAEVARRSTRPSTSTRPCRSSPTPRAR